MFTKKAVISREDIDQSALVGKELKIKTEQFPGRLLSTRIIGISGENLTIDRSGSSGFINQLIGNQNIEVYLDYKGEQVVFSSVLSKPKEGRIQIPLTGDIIPEVNRRFIRVELELDVRLTFFDNNGITSSRLNKLRWFKTKTVNVSGGGMLIEIPVSLSNEYFMILHLGLEKFDMPVLMIGDIRHSRAINNNYYTGVEFIIRENHKKRLPKTLVRNLPDKLLTFNREKRENLNVFLTEKYGNV